MHFISFHFQRQGHWRDKATRPSSCTGFPEREKGMSGETGGGGESFRREGRWQAGLPLLFTLSLFSPPIHSFRSFVCLTNHYNHTQLNGEECELSKELSWPSTCVVPPAAHPRLLSAGLCSQRPPRPGTLLTMSPTSPAACLLLLPSNL